MYPTTTAAPTYSRDNLLNLLLVRFTLEDVPYLLQRNVLLVPQADDFVKRAEQFKGGREDRGFVQRGCERGREADDERQGLQVLERCQHVKGCVVRGEAECSTNFLERRFEAILSHWAYRFRISCVDNG